jgi:hypothetical protein
MTPKARAGWAGSNADATNVGKGGNYNNIVLDSTGNPHIVFQDVSQAVLGIADYSGSSWTVTYDTANNNRGFGASMVRSTATGVYFISHEQTSPKRLYFSKRTGNSGGLTSSLQAVSGNINDSAETAIAISNGDKNVHIVYYESKSLKYIVSTDTGTTFSLPTLGVIDTGLGTNGVGRYAAITATGTAGVHVSYYDVDNGDLKYAFYNGLTWSVTTVDSTGVVGLYTSIVLDSSGRPHISYYDQTNGNLKYAFKTAGGTWTIQTVDSLGDVGKYTCIRMGTQYPQISYYDVTNTNLKWAR